MNIKEVEELKKKFDSIIQKYNFNTAEKTQELVDYIMSKSTHSAQDFSERFGIEIDEAHILLQFFQKGLEFSQTIEKK